MLIWKGNGFLAIIIPVMIFIPVLMIFAAIRGSDDFTGIGIAISLALSSFATWKVGKRLNGGDGKILIDPDTGEKVLL